MTLMAILCGLAVGLLAGILGLQPRLRKLQAELSDARAAQARLQALVDAMRATEQRADAMRAEFRQLAGEILAEKSASLKEVNREQLDTVLAPLKENIDRLGRSLTDSRVAGAQQKEALEHALRDLVTRTERLGHDAEQLTKALRANPKMQGDWGEMILERMLEESGLRKGEEYFIQENHQTDDGRNVRPDVVVRFPERRSVVIDSKVSFTAYVNYVNATDDEQRNASLIAHVNSLRAHIDELAAKDYAKVVGDAIGYVLMFVPNEGAYIAALEKDRDLLTYAYRRRVVLISPSNLVMALQLAYNLWQSEKQTRNVEEIIRRGNLLYEKFVTFTAAFERIGRQLDDTRRLYDQALGTLSRGNGNLVSGFLKLKDLGLTPKRDISPTMTERADTLPGD